MIVVGLPGRISRLGELAHNLWWSWHEEARQLFRALDYSIWRISGHNPVKVLRDISPGTLQAASVDPSFLALYDSVMAEFDANMSNHNNWFSANYPSLLGGPIAYFSMEYAIHNSLPIYAGGLGILAGDICKEASDLGLPIVAVGFMYPQGYFQQHVSPDGWQQEIYCQLNFEEAPISRVFSPEGRNAIADVRLGDVTLAIGVWQVRVGRTNIYLLDTNLERNPDQYRCLSERLYVADRELRLQQEIVLGIGGVRVLRALGISPAIWHANEGHTSFMMLERIREEVTKGMGFTEAARRIYSTSVFTTHTPVLAGHDVFSTEMIEKYFSDYWESLGIDRATFLQLGQQGGSGTQAFNMTVLALKTAGHRNAVSRLHGQVTRRMWHGLWPDISEDVVPIPHITNGVHVPSWMAPELVSLLARYLGNSWLKERLADGLWERILDIPDEELWEVHQKLRRKLVGAVRERMRSRWVENEPSLPQMVAMGTLLDPEALTIVFARRFAEYKRPTLLFRDVGRLKRIITNRRHPVQIIFAGKSHPADMASKSLLQQAYALATNRELQGRVVFVEDYDMHLARYLVHGADVWLNTPRLLKEACGTSGMKASLNGTLHLSVPDGWWHEGYNGSNGWVIDSSSTTAEQEKDRADAAALYRLLEEEVVPLYYSQDRSGLPRGWIGRMKEAIRSIGPVFCARRMLQEYTEQMYRPAAQIIEKD